MRIAFVHKRYATDGGTERVLEGLARRLAERGHEVTVYVGSLDPRYAASRSVRIRKLPMPGPGSFLRRLQLFLGSIFLVKHREHDVVVHMGRTGPGHLWRAGGGCHRTWAEMVRSRARTARERLMLRMDVEQWFVLWHERRTLASAAHIVAPSERARADLIAAYGPSAERVVVLSNGVDTERFHPKLRSLFFTEVRDEMAIGPEEIVLLFVASDFWRKGLDRIFGAMRHLAAWGEVPRLLVLGEDHERKSWMERATRDGLRERVLFVGKNPTPERVYAACDLLVMPTRFDAFANVTLEALAAGLPVVTTASNGAVDALPETDAVAVLDDEEDVLLLAHAIVTMLDPDRLPERRLAARRCAEQCGEGNAVVRWEHFLASVTETRR